MPWFCVLGVIREMYLEGRPNYWAAESTRHFWGRGIPTKIRGRRSKQRNSLFLPQGYDLKSCWSHFVWPTTLQKSTNSQLRLNVWRMKGGPFLVQYPPSHPSTTQIKYTQASSCPLLPSSQLQSCLSYSYTSGSWSVISNSHKGDTGW